MESEEKHSKLTKKFTILIVLLGTILLGIIITIIIILTHSTEKVIDSRSFEEIFWSSGTAEEAFDTFQAKIDSIEDPEQKAQLYEERADYLFETFTNYPETYKNQIISDAIESDTLNPTPQIASKISNYYYNFGMAEEAEKYKAIFFERQGNEK